MKKIKCPICNSRYTSVTGLYSHVEKEHSDLIPNEYSAQRYIYQLRTGKDHGSCVVCKNPTDWNEVTGKYKRYCNNPKCKEDYRKQFEKRMLGAYGKTTLLNDPDQQRKMLAHRKISGEYKWSDGTVKTYTGSYELDFLTMLDSFMNFDSDDVMSPSPHTYYYTYQGEKKFYIPDVFIPSLNLEIEIKDGGDNPNRHPKIVAVDKVKEQLKDKVLTTQKEYDYIKITNKDYSGFFNYILERKAKAIGAANVDFGDVIKESSDLIVTESKTVKNDKGDVVPDKCPDCGSDVKVFIKGEPVFLCSNEKCKKCFGVAPCHESTSEDIVTESAIIGTDNDVYYDFERFIMDDTNILLITGLEGLNRSKISKDLSDTYNAIYFNLDTFNRTTINSVLSNTYTGNIDADLVSLIYKYTTSKITLVNNQIGHLEDRDIIGFIRYVFNNLSPNNKYIIESIYFYRYSELDDITRIYPLIVKHDSLVETLRKYSADNVNIIYQVMFDDIDKSENSIKWFNEERKKLNQFSERTLEYRSNPDNMTFGKAKYYPVYVILMHSGSLLANTIKKVTGDEFSHSSLSFDPSLRNMLSFGRKYYSDTGETGMVREDISAAFFKKPISFALYVTFVPVSEYKLMKQRTYAIIKQGRKLTYNLTGLIKYKLGLDAETKNKMFCSEFVSYIMNTVENKTDGLKFTQVRPEDFKHFSKFQLVQTGELSQYDMKVTLQRIKYMKKSIK